ncbi:hypothetical protein P7C73_g4859, partial [Tremellales sp. Uapishka_1]
MAENMSVDESTGETPEDETQGGLAEPPPTAPADRSASTLKLDTGKGKAVDMDVDLSSEEVVSGTEEEEDDWDSYERRRERQIQENRSLFSALGLPVPPTPASTSEVPKTPSKLRRRTGRKGPIFDRSGYVISLPSAGEVHRMACVEMPSDRGLRKAIERGDYQDCSRWLEGEARRWIYGSGRRVAELKGLVEGEGAGGVSEDFQWRKWRGLEKELRSEMRKRGELIRRDQNPEVEVSTTQEYSVRIACGDIGSPADVWIVAAFRGPDVSPVQAEIQQGKDEVPEPETHVSSGVLRDVLPAVCRSTLLVVVHYNYFEFEPKDRSWICPLCRDICNCTQCIRKRDLGHLLMGTPNGRTRLRPQLEEGKTIQDWLETTVESRGRPAPFDRVRLVDQATDIVTPSLPSDLADDSAIEASKKRRKSKKTAAGVGEDGEGGKRPRKKRKLGPKEDDSNPISLVVRLKIPPAQPEQRGKEVDSDGDTVGGYSDFDDGRPGDGCSVVSSGQSSLSLSPVSPRLPFPPRVQPTLSDGEGRLIAAELALGPQTLFDAQQNYSTVMFSSTIAPTSGLLREPGYPDPVSQLHDPYPRIGDYPQAALYPHITPYPSIQSQYHNFPPPYSHSPEMPSARNLDLLSLAASEARQSPGVDAYGVSMSSERYGKKQARSNGKREGQHRVG